MDKNKWIAQAQQYSPTTPLKVVKAKYQELVKEGYIKEKRTNIVKKSTGLTPKQEAELFFTEWVNWDLAKELIAKGIPEQTIREFWRYWSELNPSWTKALWQTKPTFQVVNRMATWCKNNKGWASVSKGKSIW